MLHQLASSLRRAIGIWRLLNHLSVRAHARFDARRAPRNAASVLSETERAIATHYETERQSLERERARAFRAERVEAITTQLSGKPQSCTAIITTTKQQLLRDFVAFDPNWRTALQLIDDRRQDQRDFQKENLLSRNPNTPHALRSIITVAAIFAGESAANSVFFRDIANGDVDSVTTAAALCIPTIFAGLAAGYIGLRCRHHIQAWVRQLGNLVLGATAFFAVVWLLAVGHIRLAAEHAPASGGDIGLAVAGVFTNLREHPLAPLDSLQALGLMAVSALAFLVAVWHGYRGFSDCYPGFSHVDRQLRAATDNAADLKRRYYRSLDRRIARAVRVVERHRRAIDRDARDALLLIDRMRHKSIGFDQKAADLHAIHARALAVYREINAHWRSDSSSIRALADELSPEGLPPLEFESAKVKIAAARDRAQSAALEAITAIEAMRTEIMMLLERYRVPILQSATPSLSAPRPEPAE